MRSATNRVLSNELETAKRECRAVFCPEPDGGYSVYARNLPGVASQGDTLDEAIENIKQAFAGAVATYESEGMEIPWSDCREPVPPDAWERWILVDA